MAHASLCDVCSCIHAYSPEMPGDAICARLKSSRCLFEATSSTEHSTMCSFCHQSRLDWKSCFQNFYLSLESFQIRCSLRGLARSYSKNLFAILASLSYNEHLRCTPEIDLVHARPSLLSPKSYLADLQFTRDDRAYSHNDIKGSQSICRRTSSRYWRNCHDWNHHY